MLGAGRLLLPALDTGPRCRGASRAVAWRPCRWIGGASKLGFALFYRPPLVGAEVLAVGLRSSCVFCHGLVCAVATAARGVFAVADSPVLWSVVIHGPFNFRVASCVVKVVPSLHLFLGEIHAINWNDGCSLY